MFAYTWPLLSLFWTFLMFAGIFLLLFFIIWCFVDNFRRRDHHGAGQGRLDGAHPARAVLRRPDLHHRPASGRAAGRLSGVGPGDSAARIPTPAGSAARGAPGGAPTDRRKSEFRSALAARYGSGPQGNAQEPAMQNHHPKITQRPDRTWVVECAQCRNDLTSTVPIGIGMPLQGPGDGRAAPRQPCGPARAGRRLVDDHPRGRRRSRCRGGPRCGRR